MRRDRSASPERDSATGIAAPHPAQRLRTASGPVYWTVIASVAMLTLALGIAALQVPTAGGAAVWWPAAGTSVLLALLYRGTLAVPLAIVALTAALANVLAGRPVAFAVVAVVILTVEVVVVVALTGRHGEMARLDSVRGLSRFFIACTAGALTVSVLGAASLAVLAGAPPVRTALALFLSHSSALLLVASIALVPFSRRPLTVKPLRIAEGVIQFTVTLVLAAVIFSPLLPVPMLFTLFPVLAWAAARFRPLYVVVQLAAIALLIPALNLLLGGPYRDIQGVPQAGLLVQLFMISAAITTLFLAVGRSEREALLDDRERRSALLRGGFIGAQVGFLVAQRDDTGDLRFVEANDVGTRMATGGWLEPILNAWLQHPDNDLTQEVTLPSGRSYQVYASLAGGADAGEGAAPAVGVQLVEITDTIAARDALARTLDRERAVTVELRELARQKDVFVSAVSHELRTPITSILGFAEELEDHGAPDTRKAAEIIVRNSHRLAAMVEQLLELGRVADPESHRVLASTELDRLVREAVEEQTRSATRRSIAITVDLGAGDREVVIERLSLGRVLTNLLSNAVKFTPDGGQIHVISELRGARALVHIDDSGVGIDEADRPRVFERFFRSSDESKLATPGTGLGLPIVKALVESAGGEVTIHDSALGGTRMTVALPLTPSRESAPPASSTPAAATQSDVS